MKRVVVVGSSGQDGRILCERLRGEGAEVLEISREGLPERPRVHIASRQDVTSAVAGFRPQEIYYLAAHHHSSQDNLSSDPLELLVKSFEVHVTGLLHFLEAIRTVSPATRLFYAASSLIFGAPPDATQDEETPLNPRCAYGVTKTAGLHCCRLYRNTHGVHASAGILYNHESPYRQEKFVSQKIVRAAIRIQRGEQQKLVLGDLSARIDWGYAPDFVDAMMRVLALEKPDDFIIATGETHSVGEFVEIAFGLLGLDWKKWVEEDPGLL
jgi:GDPmannose 4,6-dehydratase